MAPPADTSHQNAAHALFDGFLLAKSCEETLRTFQELSQCLNLQPEPDGQLKFYQKLKSHLNYWKAKALWAKLDKKAGHGVYNQGRGCASTRCLVVGAGPCGLRTAIELAFLGAKVIVVEQRKSFSRNNVLHLWPFSILDLRALGAKKYHGRFCTGTLDHVSIRQLQLILLKTTLVLGVEVFVGIKFKDVLPPAAEMSTRGKGWRGSFQPNTSYLNQFQFDVLISAGGSKLVPDGFRRKELRGKLAIGITANFINRHTAEEVKVAEISGVARIYNQKFFQNLLKQTGIDLENIVYYKDDTHYFVMTAKKQSLLKMGVIVQDVPDTENLLSAENVNYDALFKYARDAASFSTGYQLPQMEFALNHQGRPDVDMFDFTCMYRSENAALVRERHGARLLIGLVGDCLVEPFWPLGTGVARGFLAAYDAAWMVKRWASGTTPLDVLAERESIYQHLSQTSPDNTNKNISEYSIDPASRYPNLNPRAIKPSQVRHLYDTGFTKRDHSKTEAKARRPVRSRKDSISVYDELLTWCRKHTAGYRGVAVTDLTHSWRSGLALCALIHRFRPHLIDFDSLDQNAAAYNNQLAFDLAEQELGILPILTGTEMACVSEPDRLSLVTYLSQFYEAFKDELLVPSPPPEPGAAAVKRTTFSGAKSAILFLNKLQKTLSLKRSPTGLEDLESKAKRKKNGSCESPEHLSPCWSSEATVSPGNQSLSPASDGTGGARNQSVSSGSDGTESPVNRSVICGSSGTLDSGPAPGDVTLHTAYPALVLDGPQGHNHSSTASPELLPSSETRQTLKGQTLTGCSDACYFCGQRVYIMERVSAEGLFFHRGCFRCHQCDTTLRLGNYAFDEDDGCFYCMIHYCARSEDYFQPLQPHLTVQETSGSDVTSLSPTVDLGHRMESGTASPPALQLSDRKDFGPRAFIAPDNAVHPPLLSPGSPYGVLPSAQPQLPDSVVSRHSKTISPVLEADVEAVDGEANGAIHRNDRSFMSCRERSQDLEERCLKQSDPEAPRPAEQCSGPQSAPPGTVFSKLEEGSKSSKISKRRIQLSDVEKKALSRLSLDLDTEAETDLRAAEPRLLTTGLDETDSCESEEGSTEEEEEEKMKTLRSPVKEVSPVRREETWKVRTLQRRAKEEEKKRFCKAQSIQRRLEEIEEQYRDLEELGIKLERSLREGPQSQEQSELIGQWLLLVQDKNVLVSEESDLMIAAQELELEEQQSLLELQLRSYMDQDDEMKTPKDRAEEALALNQMLELVNKRNALITFLDEKRLKEVTEQLYVLH